MRVLMRQAQAWQDAGGERVLDVGQVYDLPDTIAHMFLSTGAAERDEAPLLDAPETKPLRPPETKRTPGR